MANRLSRQIVMRVDDPTWARIETLMAKLTLSQSAAIRVLVAKGLEVVEREAQTCGVGDAQGR
jgi:glycerate kinase